MADDVTEQRSPTDTGASRLHRRWVPIVVATMFVATGMAFSLFWAPVVRHHPYWLSPGDVWSTYRGAHYVAWGDLGGVYSSGTALVTFPGILLLLAPVAMLTGGLGLSESFPKLLPHPAAWLVLGPYEMLLSAVALFATDALAERLGVNRARRAVLCLVEAVLLWNVSMLWGHPEDALAVGLALYALIFALDGRWVGAGWLFGAAMATQPLVLLMLPVLLALGGRRQVVGLAVRSTVPVLGLVLTPLVSQFRATTDALLEQPNFPGIDHVTPWTAMAPVLSGSGHALTVAAGPGRLVALALACCLGWWARRWREKPELIVWAAALALSLRCLTESVMVAFYIWPALAVGLVATARSGRVRLALVASVAVFTTAVSQWHLAWLPWWSIVTAGIVTALALGTPLPARPFAVGLDEHRIPAPRHESPGVLAGAMQ